MKRLMLTTLCVGVLISLAALTVSTLSHDWSWIYGAVVIGIGSCFVAGMSLLPLAGFGVGGRYTPKYFDNIRKNPNMVSNERKTANSIAMACACIGVPNIIIPLLIELVRHS